MIEFTTTLLKFDSQGEKTGWTYIKIPLKVLAELKPGNKKSFRVKGSLDNEEFEGKSLLPMGGGEFILTLNGDIRKKIRKRKGDKVKVKIMEDEKPYSINEDFMECINDDPAALACFSNLPKSHQHYYSKWIESAKTEATKAKRIGQAVNALTRSTSYSEMMRELKKEKEINDLY